jgi:hypothetical protein
MIANDFATETIMLGYGFTSTLLADLVSTGLAMPYHAPLKVGSRMVEITYIVITAAGRRGSKSDRRVHS